jgi:Leucine-rich repeat (LRR) protein
MVNLKELTMQNNGIHVLPRSVCKLFDLDNLNFSYNCMTKLLPYIGIFSKMTELHLSWNEIEELPVQV